MAHGVERRVGSRKSRRTSHLPRIADWKEDLQICGAGGKSRKRPTPGVGKKPNGKCQFKQYALTALFKTRYLLPLHEIHSRDEQTVKENTIRKIWADGGVVVNGWLAIPSSFSAEIMAHQGFDSLVVDLQHGAVDYQAAVTMLQAIGTTPVIPMARVLWNDPAAVMKMLDAGAFGVICPMVNNDEQAEALVRACKYPPRGYRSCGPIRAKYSCGADYLDKADDHTLVIPQIETAQALDNLDRILDVPGIDAVYVGPFDLAMSLGIPARSAHEAPAVLAAEKKVAETCERHGKIAGIHTLSAEAAFQAVELGYRFVTIASDERLLAAKASAEVKSIRKATALRRAAGSSRVI